MDVVSCEEHGQSAQERAVGHAVERRIVERPERRRPPRPTSNGSVQNVEERCDPQEPWPVAKITPVASAQSVPNVVMAFGLTFFLTR